MNDGSTYIFYRKVIRDEGVLFVSEGCKGKSNREVLLRRDPSWCFDKVIYRFLSWNISIPQDSSPPKSRTSVFSPFAFRSVAHSLKPYRHSWIYYCRSTYLIVAIEAETICIPLGIREQNKIE